MLTSRVFSGWLYFNMLTIRKIAKSKLINAKRKQNSAEYQTNVNVPLHLNLVRRFYLPDLLRFLNTYYYIIYIVLYYILLYFMYIILLYTLYYIIYYYTLCTLYYYIHYLNAYYIYMLACALIFLEFFFIQDL